jgi:uncharacterized protein (DUF1778 family)
MKGARAALLVRCTRKEADTIRDAAKRERRTISGYVLHSVLARIANRKELEDAWRKRGGKQARAAGELLD